MVQLLRRHDRTFNQTFHLQASILILKSVAYVNDRMADSELEIFADVRVQTHDINILNCLILADFIVKTHGFGSTPV